MQMSGFKAVACMFVAKAGAVIERLHGIPHAALTWVARLMQSEQGHQKFAVATQRYPQRARTKPAPESQRQRSGGQWTGAALRARRPVAARQGL